MLNEKSGSGSEPVSFLKLALALADDYESIYVVDLDDDSYVEYSTAGAKKEMTVSSSGNNFFEELISNTRKLVYQMDQQMFLDAFKKEKVLKTLDESKSFMLDYRLVINGIPRYYALKGIRGGNNLVIGVRNIDSQRRREIAEKEQNRTYIEIAQSLASLYEVIYNIDINTGHYTEYSASESFARLGIDRGGEDFFKKMRSEVIKYLHHDDCYTVMRQLEKKTLLKALEEKAVFSTVYRQMLDGKPQYVHLIAIKMKDDSDRIVIGVRNIDKQKRKEKELRDENRTFNEIAMALAQRYEVIYHVNIENDEYREYSANEKYAKLNIGATGADFFAETQKNMKRDIYPEDYPMMALAMRKETLLEKLRLTGKTFINYRLMLDNRPQYVTLFAVKPKEDSKHIIVAVANVDAARRSELDISDAIGSAMDMANRDGLTGVKNKRAYEQAEIQTDEQISAGESGQFAVAICDINGLKQVNDSMGHHAGDEYIKSACALICNTFKHSPVYRIGGDEFAVILKGVDFDARNDLINDLNSEQDGNISSGQVTVAVGISDFISGSDKKLQDVFERADEAMYENKKQFKLQHR